MKIKFSFCAVMLCITVKCFAQSNPGHTAPVVNDGKLWASLWQQRAAEYKALCFQAYNLAALRIDQAISHRKKGDKPLAVITDIDETLLDNSPEDARAAFHNQEFDSKAWKRWTTRGIADTVPGAPAFFKYAAKRGVAVFYISNRDEDESAGTLKNLRRYHLPYADNAHLLLKGATSSKEDRRQLVLKKYKVVLLCGDNLADFDALYDNHPDELHRAAATQKLMKQFGSRYIVLPNASYGDWESSLFHFNYKLSQAQKDSIVRSEIKQSEP
jgi:5'-nucleotidase (lipoprotein e(P4) family)